MSLYLPVLDYGKTEEENQKADEGPSIVRSTEIEPMNLLVETRANLQETLPGKSMLRNAQLKKAPSSQVVAQDGASDFPSAEGSILLKGRESHEAAVKGRPRQCKTRRDKGSLEERKQGRAERRVKALLAIHKVVLEVQMKLLDGVTLQSSLDAAARILTQANYEDVVVERALGNMCGYPLCMQKLPEQTRKGRYHVSLSQKKVYNVEDMSRFCCPHCAMKSKRYSLTLRISHPSSFEGLDIDSLIATIRNGVVSAATSPCSASNDRPAPKVGEPSLQNSDSHIGSDAPPILQNVSSVNGTQPEEVQIVISHGPEAGAHAVSSSPLVVREKLGGNGAVLPEFPVTGPSDAIEGYVPRLGAISSQERKFIFSDEKAEKLHSSSKACRVEAGTQNTGERRSPPRQSLEEGKSRERDEAASRGSPAPVGGVISLVREMAGGDAASVKVDVVGVGGAGLHVGKRRISWADEEGLPLVSVQEIPGIKELQFLAEVTRAAEINMDASVVVPGSSDQKESLRTKGMSSREDSQESTAAREGSREGNLGGQEKKSVVCEEEDDRVRTAKAIASALAEAAEVAVTENVDCKEAVARVGLAIMPKQHPEEELTAQKEGKSAGSGLKPAGDTRLEAVQENMSHGDGSKWMPDDTTPGIVDSAPRIVERGLSCGLARRRKSKNGVHATKDGDGADVVDGDVCTVDKLRGLPPKGFRKELSVFGTTWMALEEWVSADTIAFIYGEQDLFANVVGGNYSRWLSAGGRDYQRRATMLDGTSAEIGRAFAMCMSRALPDVLSTLKLTVALPDVEKAMRRLVDTMTFLDPLPNFRVPEWRMVAALMVDALAVGQLPALAPQMQAAAGSSLREVLARAHVKEDEYCIFREVLLPWGNSPRKPPSSGHPPGA